MKKRLVRSPVADRKLDRPPKGAPHRKHSPGKAYETQAHAETTTSSSRGRLSNRSFENARFSVADVISKSGG